MKTAIDLTINGSFGLFAISQGDGHIGVVCDDVDTLFQAFQHGIFVVNSPDVDTVAVFAAFLGKIRGVDVDLSGVQVLHMQHLCIFPGLIQHILKEHTQLGVGLQFMKLDQRVVIEGREK